MSDFKSRHEYNPRNLVIGLSVAPYLVISISILFFTLCSKWRPFLQKSTPDGCLILISYVSIVVLALLWPFFLLVIIINKLCCTPGRTCCGITCYHQNAEEEEGNGGTELPPYSYREPAREGSEYKV
ncbi:hypothetical protein QBC38DRAFT_117891 [Podospora fimiseda]|uniref:Uncharacterized protein n=1 Tax=Podospora fimiseda TaxID=252190 RepID=A0AAN6YNP7_9PEZI|nr:hypothetical protein QBC38DRAFT_117891 [Podospora fimiseda]